MFQANRARLPQDSLKRFPIINIQAALFREARGKNQFGRVVARLKKSSTLLHARKKSKSVQNITSLLNLAKSVLLKRLSYSEGFPHLN